MNNNTYFVKLDYIWMSNDFEDVDFPGDPFDVRLVLDFILLQYFDCNLLAGDQVCAQSYFTEGTLSEWATFMRKNEIVLAWSYWIYQFKFALDKTNIKLFGRLLIRDVTFIGNDCHHIYWSFHFQYAFNGLNVIVLSIVHRFYLKCPGI